MGRKGGRKKFPKGAGASPGVVELSRAAEEEKEERQKQWLAELGLERKFIPKDGGCMFRALSECIHSTQCYHLDMRRRCVEFLSSHAEEYAPFVEEPFDHYLHDMAKPDSWGGQLELLAISQVYNVVIYVYDLNLSEKVVIGNPDTATKVCKVGFSRKHYDCLYEVGWLAKATICQQLVFETLAKALAADYRVPQMYKNIGLTVWKKDLDVQKKRDRRLAASLEKEDYKKLSGYYEKDPTPGQARMQQLGSKSDDTLTPGKVSKGARKSAKAPVRIPMDGELGEMEEGIPMDVWEEMPGETSSTSSFPALSPAPAPVSPWGQAKSWSKVVVSPQPVESGEEALQREQERERALQRVFEQQEKIRRPREEELSVMRALAVTDSGETWPTLGLSSPATAPSPTAAPPAAGSSAAASPAPATRTADAAAPSTPLASVWGQGSAAAAVAAAAARAQTHSPAQVPDQAVWGVKPPPQQQPLQQQQPQQQLAAGAYSQAVNAKEQERRAKNIAFGKSSLPQLTGREDRAKRWEAVPAIEVLATCEGMRVQFGGFTEGHTATFDLSKTRVLCAAKTTAAPPATRRPFSSALLLSQARPAAAKPPQYPPYAPAGPHGSFQDVGMRNLGGPQVQPHGHDQGQVLHAQGQYPSNMGAPSGQPSSPQLHCQQQPQQQQQHQPQQLQPQQQQQPQGGTYHSQGHSAYGSGPGPEGQAYGWGHQQHPQLSQHQQRYPPPHHQLAANYGFSPQEYEHRQRQYAMQQQYHHQQQQQQQLGQEWPPQMEAQHYGMPQAHSPQHYGGHMQHPQHHYAMQQQYQQQQQQQQGGFQPAAPYASYPPHQGYAPLQHPEQQRADCSSKNSLPQQ